MGKANATAIGTLVERTTNYTLLLHLPNGHSAEAVTTAITEAMAELPKTLRRSLTWDQGKELSDHKTIARATDLAVYFCDPHSPWQRPVNENTNKVAKDALQIFGLARFIRVRRAAAGSASRRTRSR